LLSRETKRERERERESENKLIEEMKEKPRPFVWEMLEQTLESYISRAEIHIYIHNIPHARRHTQPLLIHTN
jgi:hypothetical protein